MDGCGGTQLLPAGGVVGRAALGAAQNVVPVAVTAAE